MRRTFIAGYEIDLLFCGCGEEAVTGVLIGFVVGGGEQIEAKFANGAKPFPAAHSRRFSVPQRF
jgi:hypothetical protein